MEALGLLYGFYFVPAVVLFGLTIIAALLLKSPKLFWFEFVTWALPGLTYWLLFVPLDLESVSRGKTLGNLIEPSILAVVSWLIFLVRLIVARRRPTSSRSAAAWAIVASNLAAGIVLLAMPSLPE